MPLAMPFVWDERCRAHEPRSELSVGVPTPAAEIASRIDAIRSTLVEAHAQEVAAVPHAVDALLAVHDPELLAYLEAAWDRARRAPTPAGRRGITRAEPASAGRVI